MRHTAFFCSVILAIILSSGTPAIAETSTTEQVKYPNTWFTDNDKTSDWYQQCMKVKHLVIPEQDLPPKNWAQNTKNCDAQNLYYNSLTQDEWDKTRYCAISSNDDAVLMMLYANGYGVKKDYDLAIKYACQIPAAQFETSGRVIRLASRPQGGPTNEAFDQCDDASSKLMINTCAWIQKRFSDRKLARSIENLTTNWTDQQKKSFEKLLASHKQYEEVRGRSEWVCLTATCGSEILYFKIGELDKFINEIRKIEEDGPPKFTINDYQSLDQNLNDIYQSIMADPDFGKNSTIQKNMIRKTQRAWLKYREAWVLFGKTKYPDSNISSWRAYITQQRIFELKDLDTDH